MPPAREEPPRRRRGRVLTLEPRWAKRAQPRRRASRLPEREESAAGRPRTSEDGRRARVRRALAAGLAGRPFPSRPLRFLRGGSGLAHGGENPRISAAAADVAGERLDDLLVGRVRIRREERGRGDDHSRRAIAALKRLLIQERLLRRMQASSRRESFDRRDLRAGRLRYRSAAGARGTSIQKNRARAALPFAAAVLGAGETQPVAQDR